MDLEPTPEGEWMIGNGCSSPVLAPSSKVLPDVIVAEVAESGAGSNWSEERGVALGIPRKEFGCVPVDETMECFPGRTVESWTAGWPRTSPIAADRSSSAAATLGESQCVTVLTVSFGDGGTYSSAIAGVGR